MKIGASVATYTTTWDNIHAAIETLEAGRWDSLWFPDHFIPPQAWKGAQDEPIYEAWTLIAAAAGMTEKLRLGHLVTGNTYRNPALLAKMATTVDQVSHGRLTLSIGAAWFKREHEAYGWEYPSMRERQDRFEEACALIRALLHRRRAGRFRGPLLQARQRAVVAPFVPEASHTHHGRRTGRAPDTAHPRKVRRPVEPGRLRHGPRGCPSTWRNVPGPVQAQGRRHKPALRETWAAIPRRSSTQSSCRPSSPNDQAEADEFIQRVGPGTVAGTASYIIDRIGEFADAGVHEIMLAPRPSDAESLHRLDEEVLAAFD